MRKFILPFLLGVAITSGLAFKVVSEIKKSSASVNQYSDYKNLYVFTDSKPMVEYDTIGQVEARGVFNKSYTDYRNSILERCNKTYPKADGIMYNTNPKVTDRAWVIQFKK